MKGLRLSKAFVISMLSLLWLCLISLPPLAYSASVNDFLIAQKVFLDPSTSKAHVLLKNVGSKIITAYALSVLPDNVLPTSEEFFMSIGLDPTLVPDSRPPYTGGLRPGEIRDFEGWVRVNLIPQVTISAVIFEDRTAVGDDSVITQLFKSRSEQAIEAKHWCEQLNPDRFRQMNTAESRSALADLVGQLHKAESESKLTAGVSAQNVRDRIMGLLGRLNGLDPSVIANAFSFEQGRCAVMSEHAARRVGRVQ